MTSSGMRTALVALVLTLVLVGCSPSPGVDDSLGGRILIWHSWSESESAVLDEVIGSFTDLHPAVTVMHQAFGDDGEMRDQFVSAVAAGFGPDLLLVPAEWSRSLAGQGLIDAIELATDDEFLARYAPTTLDLVRDGERLLGLPVSLDTVALFYHRRLVESPASTLDELVAQATGGKSVLLPTNFEDAFWGIQAFGGQLFDDDGRAILDRGGFANWLAWLRDARSAPGMIQDSSRAVLRRRFLEGDDAYYVGYASELNQIIQALGENSVGVALLPSGPVAPSAPLLSGRAFVFSAVSSSSQRRVALELAKFVTNQEQSARLMRAAYRIPANTRVRINARLNPFVATFATQARAAVALAGRSGFDAAQRLGTEAYNRVLEGGEAPTDIALAITNSINEANGFEVHSAPASACTGLGTTVLALVGASQKEEFAFAGLAEGFRRTCPFIIVRVVRMELTELLRRFGPENAATTRPAFAVVDQSALPVLLGETPTMKNITPLITPETLQRFLPNAAASMRVQTILYGLPLSLQVNALYYNRNLIAQPAQLVDDLRTQAASGVPIVMDTRFDHAFWGIGAFGGDLFDADGRAILDEGGFAGWLAWLRESRDVYGIRLTNDGGELLDLFAAGQSAYYVGSAGQLDELVTAIGNENLGVALLPAGPGGLAQPFVSGRGVVFRADLTDSEMALALEFARYATDVDGQSILMSTAGYVPANAAVTTGDATRIGVFSEQAQNAYLLPNSPEIDAALRLADRAFEAVLSGAADPVAAVAEVTDAINRANGLEDTAPATETPAETPVAPPDAAPVVAPDETPDPRR